MGASRKRAREKKKGDEHEEREGEDEEGRAVREVGRR